MNLKSIQSSNFLGQKIKDPILLDLSINSEYANSSNWFEQINVLSHQPQIYYGGYLEKRFFYKNEMLFGQGDDARIFHLGFDVWMPQGTSIYSPYNGIVHSFKNNNALLDYGHALILEHSSKLHPTFYSLYGHLNKFHTQFEVGDKIQAGQKICELGSVDENGGWPPHLHLQLIEDLGEYVGDYPGVCSYNQLEYYKKNCPDPTFLFTRYAR